MPEKRMRRTRRRRVSLPAMLSHHTFLFDSFSLLRHSFSIIQADGYDPKKSKVSDDTMENWRNTPTNPDLNSVPGIGPATIRKLAESEEIEDRITNTYQLFGKFLMLKGPGHSEDEIEIDSMEHMEKFWHWLKNRGISSHRSAIVKAIAEKSATFFQNIYDVNAYDEDDDEDE